MNSQNRFAQHADPCYCVDHIVDIAYKKSYFIALRHKSTGKMYLFIVCRNEERVYYRSPDTRSWEITLDAEDYKTIVEVIYCCLSGQEHVFVLRY